MELFLMLCLRRRLICVIRVCPFIDWYWGNSIRPARFTLYNSGAVKERECGNQCTCMQTRVDYGRLIDHDMGKPFSIPGRGK